MVKDAKQSYRWWYAGKNIPSFFVYFLEVPYPGIQKLKATNNIFYYAHKDIKSIFTEI